MKKIIILMIGVFLFSVFLMFAIQQVKYKNNQKRPAVLLEQTAEKIRNTLDDMDESLEIAKVKLLANGIDSPAAKTILKELYKDNIYAFDCLITDNKGIVKVVVPEEKSYLLGVDISHQEQFVNMLETRKSVMSAAINTVEGFIGFGLAHPIFDGAEQLIGCVSLLIDDSFWQSTLSEQVKENYVNFYVLQKDGRVIYDINSDEIGKYLFEDEMYKEFPSLLEAGRKIVANNEGEGNYIFFDENFERKIRKELLWTTIELYGTEFRLAMAYIK